jgi:hypothetical protein
MDYLQSLSTTWIIVATTVLLGIGFVATMGLFGSKNRMPVEGRVSQLARS